MRRALGIFLIAAVAALAQDRPLAVEQEPHHSIRFQNQYLRVVETYIPAGESSQFHTHTRESIGVVVGPAPVEERILGHIAVEERPEPAGALQAGDYAAHPFTHREWNLGKRPYRVMTVELLHRPSKLPAEPDGPGDPDAETPHLAAFRYVLPAGTVSPMHSHTRPYLVIAATVMKLTTTSSDGHSQTENLLPGDFHWVDRGVTHELRNSGGDFGQVVEIEVR